MPIILVLFAIFFCCCIAQFYFLRRVRQSLATKHPDVWRDMSSRAWFLDNDVYKFAWKRRDKRLNDPALTRRVEHLLRLNYFAIGVWLIYAGLLITGIGLHRL